MPPELRQRFEALLLSLPEWEREETRRALLNCLRPYRMWDHFDPGGTTADASERLFRLETKFGCEPFEALLGELRERYSIHPQRCEEIVCLREDLRRLARRPMQSWHREPYLGLTYFDRSDAPIFFGRDTELAELVEALTGTEQGRRFLLVAGASGSGKSSLIRAGLWAGLEEGRIPQIPGSRHWLITAMIPGQMHSPTASLRAAFNDALRTKSKFRSKSDLAAKVEDEDEPLNRLAEEVLGVNKAADARWLLIVDQLEELFTGEKRGEGARFLDRLIEATQPGQDGKPSRFQVIATLRSDFLGHCADHPPLRRVLNAVGGQFMLGAPNRVALERMVSGPIQELDLGTSWWLDPALAGTIATQAQQHPGGLALMAFALQELYNLCQPKLRLDVATYEGKEFGGLSGAIARRAEATLMEIPSRAVEALSRVFQRLVRVSPGEAATRRREQLSAWEGDADAVVLIESFVKARLLVATAGPSGESLVEVAHEALLREWPTLANWIELRREAFGLANRVRTEAQAWMSGDPARHHRRPWPTDLIEEFRGKLADAGLLDMLMEDPAVQRLLLPEVDWIQVELDNLQTMPLRRAEIGRRLAEMGDPRPGVGLAKGLPEIVWCVVPGGEVEIKAHGIFPVATFEIAKYPVTAAQFLAFVEADDYHKVQWWEGLQEEAVSRDWKDLRGNQPVTSVSWFGAVAFCRWLTQKLGYGVRLPTESEWQWAAQSARAEFQYPWGEVWLKGRANTWESEIRQSVAVGLFPGGNSLYQQVSDLSGNVWEWCLNPFDNPKETGLGTTEWRALRGGAWYNQADYARAGYRDESQPRDRNGNIGFRLVRSSPIR